MNLVVSLFGSITQSPGKKDLFYNQGHQKLLPKKIKMIKNCLFKCFEVSQQKLITLANRIILLVDNFF
jgi:hypothetical protein